ncbi:MAG TPA: DUF3048 domain-containing protein [Bacillota bacterium]|nr:DUF3048 domain-containing protein [Bacillota bacterium]
MRKITVVWVAMIMVIVFGACSKDEAKESMYPLTGEKTKENVDHRVVGVMVNNHPKARPQSGLSKADIVFEMLVEGDITRFLALYHSEEPKVVGPVRSAREYYFDLADGYDALYVYHGAADFVNDMIEDRGFDHLNGSKFDDDGNLFKRESFRNSPHNSYLQFKAVTEVAEEEGYDVEKTIDPLPFLSRDELDSLPGESAEQIEIHYTMGGSDAVVYNYDESTEMYTRANNGEETVEYDSHDPIEVDNVFVIEAHHEVMDDEGRRTIDLESGGNAYLIQKGKVNTVQWERQDGKLIPVKDGDPLGFVPGKTWVNVVPANPGLEQSVMIE